jgi:hypothetical protein
MKARTCLLLVPVLLLCLGALGQTAQEQALLKIDNARLEVLQKGDAAALDKMLGRELTYVRPDGSVWDRATYLDAVRSGKLKFTAIKHSEVKARVIGDVGIITGRSDASLTEAGRGQQGGPARYANVYAREKGEWKLVLMQVTRIAGGEGEKSR